MIKYYMRPDSNTPPSYVYIEGPEDDLLWDPDICLEVPKMPSPYHVFDRETKSWKPDDERALAHFKALAEYELERTSKWMVIDSPLSDEEMKQAKAYRAQLRTLTDDPGFLNHPKLPECPACLK